MRWRTFVLCLFTCLNVAGTALWAQDQVSKARPILVTIEDAILPEETATRWRDFLQLAWNAESGAIERKRLRILDPLASKSLVLAWKTDQGVIPSGPIEGEGQIEWRKPDALGYGAAGLVATFSGELRQGAFWNKGRYWHRSGTFYEGQWQNGLMHGQGYLHLPDGRSYDGGFERGRFSGQGTLLSTNGARFEGRFAEGLRNGPGKETRADGTVFVSFWTAGAEDLTKRRILVDPEDIKPTLAQQTAYADLTFGVTVDRRTPLGAFAYEGRNEANALVAFPKHKNFMQAWRSGGTIPILNDSGATERFTPANFLMTLENRGRAPVQVLGGYLAVQTSVPDLDPYLEFYRELNCGQPYLTKIKLFNMGWSDPIGARVEGGMISRDGSRYVVPLQIPPLNGWPIAEFDVGPPLWGAEPRSLPIAQRGLYCPSGAFEFCLEQAKAQGAFGNLAEAVYQQGDSILADFYGIVSYNWRDHTGTTHSKQSAVRSQIKVGAFVSQNECGEGDGYASPFPNPFRLPVNQSNYRYPFSLYATLQPGTTSNWNFQIDAEMASRHVFSVVLQLSDGREIVSRPVDLTYFKDKSPW